MGCSNSKSLQLYITSPENTHLPKETHPLVTTKASTSQKIKIIEAVKKDDYFLLKKLLNRIPPTENLGTKGDNFTCLHAAAFHNSYIAMAEMISWLKKNSEHNICQYTDIKDADGITPVVHCIRKDSFETLYVLFQNEAINLQYRDTNGQSLVDICTKHESRCLDILLKSEVSQPMQGEEKMISRKKMYAIKKENDGNADNVLSGVPTNSKVYQLITDLQKTETIFIDNDFSTTVDSITIDRKHKDYKIFAEAVWKRPHEIFECDYKDIHLFDNIDVNDIAQGVLGVCYLLSSLSALAEFPSRLASIYLNTNANKYGVYGLKLYLRGIPTEIIVDDCFPCYKGKNLPLFSRPKGKELWVMLAEKAWAKVFKSYTACEIGFMDEALECLTGAPSVRHFTESQDMNEIWETIFEADRNNFIITAGTHQEVAAGMGLVPNHGYSIISIHNFKQYKILKLRNPWGKFEWKGDFSDNSKLWTKEMKEVIGYSNADDGIFCMKVEDFKKNFSFYSIGMYHDGWEYTYLEASSRARHGEYFKFKIDKPCEAYFRIHQEDKRSKPESENYEYSSGDLVVCKVEADGTLNNVFNLEGVDMGIFFGARSMYPCDDRKVKLTPGEYLIRTKIRWRNEQGGDFTLSSYAPFKIDLERVPPVKDYVKRMLQNYGQKMDKKSFPQYNIKLGSGFYSHFLITYLENNGSQPWDWDVTYDKMENIRLGKYGRVNDNTVRVSVKPGTVEVLIGKKIDVSGTASFNYKIN